MFYVKKKYWIGSRILCTIRQAYKKLSNVKQYIKLNYKSVEVLIKSFMDF